jgi:hypothetical protein
MTIISKTDNGFIMTNLERSPLKTCQSAIARPTLGYRERSLKLKSAIALLLGSVESDRLFVC